MWNIQIDTKSLFNNIKLSFFASHIKRIFNYVRLLDTLQNDFFLFFNFDCALLLC